MHNIFVQCLQTLLFLQWEIYDFYVEELQKREKSKEKQESQFPNKEEDKSKKKMIQAETQVARKQIRSDAHCKLLHTLLSYLQKCN